MATITFHEAGTRGHANHGWLDSHHTFSFANYQNAARIHFGALRVLNDDIVNGGKGFGKHPHDNMEIVSIPLKGALEHRDTTGRHAVIQTGDVQIMSAGSGISHSEMNASKSEDVNFLQIWVFPKIRNIAPRYVQKTFDAADRINKWQLVVSPEAGSGALWINQDAWFVLGDWDKGMETSYSVHQKGNGVYAFIISGEATVNGQLLKKRDGAGILSDEAILIKAEDNTQMLLMEVPMEF